MKYMLSITIHPLQTNTQRKKLEKIRKRPLITYVTSIRPGCSAQMDQDVLPLIIKQINAIDNNNAIDLLIISNGGDPIVSWRIISLLREKFKKVSVLIPYTAFSAATLLALGADEIIMHPYGNLGPLDPQLSFSDAKGNVKTISYENITKYIEFVKDTGITDQELLQKSFEKLTSEIPPTLIGFAKRSSQLGLTMGQKLLATHMNDENKTKLISETLNTKFYHHGYPLARKEAKDIGLPVAESNSEIEKLMWDIYEDYMNEMQFNNIFNPQAIIMKNIANNPQSIPNKINIVKEQIKLATLESTRMNCFINETIMATYAMSPDTSLNLNISVNQGDWVVEESEEKND